jgi:hypothetical protein
MQIDSGRPMQFFVLREITFENFHKFNYYGFSKKN